MYHMVLIVYIFLNEKKSGLQIICSKEEYLFVQLKNVTS